ncbi:cysteine--tRNA ligase [Lactobacillus selangorensis]|uniref:Cysteine--tRNA ligase n=1 Tax=Lactobacillus selangorensis TaxID=81857 RepID=A0A0R2FV05_9LACO|nr:cysteine--tRNA ligase [Lactobacillus selangorensis]KRN29191.1 cysteine--tRNA ligase [Lactobacillus selangorensis]KRN31451.1 cysteine--tRNA ligase [Lactobacillus selangorensis]
MLQLFNTLTRQKEAFKPIHPGEIGMYVCGPTVYNYIHIGNARSVVAFDTIRRYFEYSGYKVKYVSNFTDVDDKMINTARDEGITVPELADRYIQAFMEDTKALNVEPATLNPRATENIPDIIQFIQGLIDKGYAYAVDGDVYYHTRKFADYGKLSDQNIDELEQGASMHTNNEETERKQDPIDFALWKAQKQPDEIAWQSPWGMGRPGWHIECSVMSTKYLGATFDIHGGGEDLEFPHHENEIAQSEAETGQTFVHYWMHNGFVTIGDDDQKMSKSLGNFVTVHDLVKKVDPQVLRFFIATTQYRKPIRYSEQTLNEAAINLNRLKTAYNNLMYRYRDAQDADNTTIDQQVQDLEAQFKTAMDDDINVQNGMTVIYELAKLINNYVAQDKVAKQTLDTLKDTYTRLLSIFGVTFAQKQLLDRDIEKMIHERNEARANHDYARSDELRDLLKDEGIILEDTPQGTRWHRDE